MQTRHGWQLCLALVVCSFSMSRSSAMTTVWLNYANFTTRLNQLANQAGVPQFDAAEEAEIKANISSRLDEMFDGFTVDFSETQPGGSFPTLSYGLTAAPGALGLADHIDYRNKHVVDLGRIYSANFNFIVENTDSREQQIFELSNALANTSGHELGHNIGLRHHDAYGDPGIVFVGNPINTGGIQNTHVMATGPTGCNEACFEGAQQTFSEHSLVKISFAEGFNASIPATIAEGADFGDTTGDATPLTFTNLTNVDRAAVNVAGQLGTTSDADVFAISLEAGTRFHADVNIDFPNSIPFENVDTFMELIGPDGSTVIASDDSTAWNGNSFGAGNGDFDPWLVNVPITETGTHYLRLSPQSPDTGDYELLMHTDSLANVIDPDFNDDGMLDCADIDPLVAAIASGGNDPDFDLTGDGFVNLGDRDAWLTQAGAENLESGNPYLLGDATLDGVVDGFDFLAWNANKFTLTAEWCSGDFNADGIVDGLDFVEWNENKFTEADQSSALAGFGPVEGVTGQLIHTTGTSAVPEPTSWLMLFSGMAAYGLVRRQPA